MRWQAEIRAAIVRHRPGAEPDEDVVEELAQHAQAAFEAARADGADETAAAARVAALLAGWCAALATAPRRPSRTHQPPPPPAASRGAAGLLQDLRFGLRLLVRHRGFTAGAGITLALGVAAATVVFGLVEAVLLRPLPWPQSDRLVRLAETRRGATNALPPLLTNATYLAWRARHETLTDLAAWSSGKATLQVGAGEPRRVHTMEATASLFPLLAARPQLGRLYSAADEDPARGCNVLLSHAAWREWLGGRADVVGRRVRLDGRSCSVIGVMPASFYFPTPEVEAWLPLHVPPVARPGEPGEAVSLLGGLGRLAPGATPAQAAAEGSARGATGPQLHLVAMAVFGASGPPVVMAEPLLDVWTAEVRPALLLLLAAVGLLLLAAVANLAGIQLARALVRRREIAIRAAIGAGTGRLARQLLVENALLGALAGLAGLGLAWGVERLLPRLAPRDFPRLHELGFDLRVAAFALLLATLAGVALALLPVALVRRSGVRAALADAAAVRLLGRVQLSVGRGRAAMMAVQVGLAVALLVGAGLLVRSFRAELLADRGYEPRHLLTATLVTTGDGVTPARRTEALDTLLARLAARPGVRVAAATNVLPLLANEALTGFTLPARDGRPARQAQAGVRTVSPGYFAALGRRTLAGRDLRDSDGPTSEPVVVVNRAFERAYLGGAAVGTVLPLAMDEGKAGWRVVGVVEDVRQKSASDPPLPEMFVSYRQLSRGVMSEPVLLVRTAGDPAALVPEVRDLVRDAAPVFTLDSVSTMEERLGSSLARPRLYALLLALFAVFTVLVTGAGLFGMLSYAVAQRRRELALRAAMGATPRSVVALVLRQSLLVTSCGLAGGLLLAFALRRSVARFLYGVAPGDPLTWLLACAVLLVVALAAAALPARRAARLDPLRALAD